jgi:AcrR family transcriptional regulator
MDRIKTMTKRQIRAAQTRENLLKAGREVFLENGFQKATMTQIHKIAKTGYGTAYVYFRNKDDLFVELMETVMKKMYEVADLPFRPKTKEEAFSRIKKQASEFLKAALEEKAIMQVVKEAIGASEMVSEKWNQIRTRFINGITADIRFVQKAGLARQDLDPHLIAKGWFYMNEQLMWDLVLGEVDDDLEKVAENMVELYIGGLYG